MEIIIDEKSGFCFGVRKAINFAEEELKSSGTLYCLGEIVHNEMEVNRLENLGLKVIQRDEFYKLSNCKVLIRAHGEPPEVYQYAEQNHIELFDGTCPVVLKLQEKVKFSYEQVDGNGSIVILGKHNHPEIIGLDGQIKGKAFVVQDKEDLSNIDFTKPVVLYSQTTMSKEKYWELKSEIENRLSSPDLLEANDTICGQVSNRAPGLQKFSSLMEAIVFVGGKKSSNSKVLYQECKNVNQNSFFVSTIDEVMALPLQPFQKVGICGATSTPRWLMEEVAEKIKTTFA